MLSAGVPVPRHVGLHRTPTTLRPARPGGWVPPLAGLLTALVGLVNVVSALLPELPGRLQLLSTAAPSELVVGAHALALPAGLGLLVVSVFLKARRQRAQRLAVALLLVLGVLNLLKGLDYEEATLSWVLAALLVWHRRAFRVRHDVAGLPRVLRLNAAVVACALTVAIAVIAAAGHWATPQPTPGTTLREAAALLALTRGPLHYSSGAGLLRGALGGLGGGAAVLCAWMLLRPLQAAVAPCRRREAAGALVRAHGSDTLSFFKLREDLPRRFSPDGRALVAYRVEGGVILLSGDPVGPADALGALLSDVCAYAADHGLRVGVLGASEAWAGTCCAAGLRRLYIGDEAIVDTAAFSLEGRPIRKVRQATTRLQKAGYTVAGAQVGELDDAELEALGAISARWRDGAPERGFSMAMDSLANPALAATWLLIARDAAGTPRAFVHFVPSFGRPAMSLSFMRRDRDTPNGLTEFLVVRAIELARARGIEEMSLNFAAFGRYLREPTGRLERVVGNLARRGDRYFQVESLHRFNAKFFPRWQPRYLLYEGLGGLPRTVLAALWSEGQLPHPSVPGLRWAAPTLAEVGTDAGRG